MVLALALALAFALAVRRVRAPVVLSAPSLGLAVVRLGEAAVLAGEHASGGLGVVWAVRTCTEAVSLLSRGDEVD